MIHDPATPWADMPPWLIRLLADTNPDRAVAVALRAFKLRGASFPSDNEANEAGRRTITTICRWLRTGSRLLGLTDSDTVLTLAAAGPEPRWHALTTPEPGPIYVLHGHDRAIQTMLQTVDTEGGALAGYLTALRMATASNGHDYSDLMLAVQTGPNGPDVTAWVKSTTGGGWGTALGISGTWDFLRWHGIVARADRDPIPAIIQATFSVLLNAVAAITEAREVVRVEAPRQRRKGARRSRKLRGVRPEVYRLDGHALTAWTERRMRAKPTEAHRSPPKPTDAERKPTRAHTCREHTRRVWVRQAAEGEVVLATKLGRVRRDGSQIILYCVERAVQAHGRGSVVLPRPVVLSPKTRDLL